MNTPKIFGHRWPVFWSDYLSGSYTGDGADIVTEYVLEEEKKRRKDGPDLTNDELKILRKALEMKNVR